MRIVAALTEPFVQIVGDFLDATECGRIIEMAESRLVPSETVTSDGLSEFHAGRISEGMFFSKSEDDFISKIEQRVSDVTNIPISNMEGLQVLKYNPGGFYNAHHDFFESGDSGPSILLQRGGQRVATFIVYLNNVQAGGLTHFPGLNFSVRPFQGNALFFKYEGNDRRLFHSGTPVEIGCKWILTVWFRTGTFH